MGLEVLYGPVSCAYQGTPIDSVNGGLLSTYVQGIGLLSLHTVPHSSAIAWVSAIQLDGAVLLRSNWAGTTPLVLDMRSSLALALNNSLALYAFDYLAGYFSETAEFTVASGHLYPTIHAICADRFLQFGNSQVLSSPLTDGVTFTPEYTWPGVAPGDGTSISRGRSDTEICVVSDVTGQIRFYDILTKQQNGGVSYVGDTSGVYGVYYVPKWDVFLKLKGTQLSVLANAVRPASISNPTPTGAIQAGLATPITAQVLGADGEPCVGELVNWSITSGSGSLGQAQSTTDVNGNATNTYVAPVGSSGSVIIAAEIDF